MKPTLIPFFVLILYSSIFNQYRHALKSKSVPKESCTIFSVVTVEQQIDLRRELKLGPDAKFFLYTISMHPNSTMLFTYNWIDSNNSNILTLYPLHQHLGLWILNVTWNVNGSDCRYWSQLKFMIIDVVNSPNGNPMENTTNRMIMYVDSILPPISGVRHLIQKVNYVFDFSSPPPIIMLYNVIRLEGSYTRMFFIFRFVPNSTCNTIPFIEFRRRQLNKLYISFGYVRDLKLKNPDLCNVSNDKLALPQHEIKLAPFYTVLIYVSYFVLILIVRYILIKTFNPYFST